MRNPLIAYGMDCRDWVIRIADSKPGRDVIPYPIQGRFVWGIKYGNQRYQWAASRGYTHIATVLVDTEKQCDQWLQWYVDA